MLDGSKDLVAEGASVKAFVYVRVDVCGSPLEFTGVVLGFWVFVGFNFGC